MANYLKLNKSYIGNDILENPEFNMLGPDIIINGNFETDSNWSKDGGWQIYGGKAVCDGTSGNLQQPSILTIGKIYTVTITVSDYVSGNVQVAVGAGPRAVFTANGTYTVTQTAQPNSSFYIVSSSFEGAVESVIVQESGQIEYVDNGAFYGVTTSPPTDVITLTGWAVYGSATRNVVEIAGKNVLQIITDAGNKGVALDLSSIPTGMEVNLKIESVTGDIGNGALFLNGYPVGSPLGSIPTESGSVDHTFVKESGTSYLYFRAGDNEAGTTNYYNISVQPTNVFAYSYVRVPSTNNSSGNNTVFSENNVTFTANGISPLYDVVKLDESNPTIDGSEYILTVNVLSVDEAPFVYWNGAAYIAEYLSVGENKINFTKLSGVSGFYFGIQAQNSSQVGSTIVIDSMELQEVKNQPKLIGVDNVSTVSAPTNSTVVINNGLTDGADTVTITYAEADATSTVQMRNFFQDAIVEAANANNTGKVIETKSPVLINDIVAS